MTKRIDNTPYLVNVPGRSALHIRDGKIRISTGTSDRQEATRKLIEYVKSKCGAPKKPLKAKTFSDALRAWADERREKNERTYSRKWKYIVAGLEAKAGWLTLEEMTSAWSKTYRAERMKDGVGAATIRQELIVVVGGALRRAGVEPPEFDLPQEPDPRDVWLTKEEARQLIRACDKQHLRAFMRLGFETGGRHEALLRLTWSRVNIEGRRIDLRFAVEERLRGTKVSEERKKEVLKRAGHVRMSDALAKELLELRAKAVTPYVVEYRGKPLESIKKSFEAAVKRSGLDIKVTPHILRHSAATWQAIDGVDMWEIASFLGHAGVELVQKTYAHHHPDYMKRSNAAVDLGDI